MRFSLLAFPPVIALAACAPAVPKAEVSSVTLPEAASIVAGNNRLAFDLYGKLREANGNLFFSPYGVSTALAMVHAGARGESAAEMAKTLHFDLSPRRLHPAMREFQLEMSSDGKRRSDLLLTVNALWIGESKEFLPEYAQLIGTNYGAMPRPGDFSGKAESERQAINAWAEQHTQGKIKALIPDSGPIEDAALVLANAAYFKGVWESAFKPERTRSGPFMLAGGRKAQVPMMHQAAKFRQAADRECRLLELPYQGGEMTMTLLLPDAPDGLPALEAALTQERLTELLDLAREAEMDVALPKFNFTSSQDLAPVFQGLGMGGIFHGGLTGMVIRRELFVKSVRHQATVEVNEEGTEAAAATAVTELPIGIPVQFKADHPFLFFIRHRSSGAIVFLGRVVDPRGE